MIEPILDQQIFAAAQLLLGDTWRLSDNDMLDYLTAAWCVNGYLSAGVINRMKFTPATNTYDEHFGSLLNAYRQIGYKPFHRYRCRGIAPLLRRLDRQITGQIIRDVEQNGGRIILNGDAQVLKIDGDITVALVFVPYLNRQGLIPGWHLYLNQIPSCDIVLVIRMNESNSKILDYHFIPRLAFHRPKFRFTNKNISQFVSYKLESPSDLYWKYQREYVAAPGA